MCVDELLDGVSQIKTAKASGTLYFLVLDLNYAYSQLKLKAETAKQCIFNIVSGMLLVPTDSLQVSMA